MIDIKMLYLLHNKISFWDNEYSFKVLQTHYLYLTYICFLLSICQIFHSCSVATNLNGIHKCEKICSMRGTCGQRKRGVGAITILLMVHFYLFTLLSVRCHVLLYGFTAIQNEDLKEIRALKCRSSWKKKHDSTQNLVP